MNELDALLILNATPGLGNARIKKLLERYGSAKDVLSLRESDLTADHSVPQQVVQNLFRFSKDNFLKNEHHLITQRQVHVLTYRDKNYPKNLHEIPDAPVIIYVKGSIPEEPALSIAIVGSRRASIYGLTISCQFAVRLAELGFTVVSGMARGIDTAAHHGALKANGSTMAVLGCGLSHIYPPENKNLFEDIADRGAVISEFPMETPPVAHNFPRRNRIISGLSLGVIVVEAALKSGALITANFALEQGREVYAVPGKVDIPTSGGVNNLIKQGAELVTCVEDILEDLKPQLSVLLKDNTHGRQESRSSSAPEDKSRFVGYPGAGDRLSNLSENERHIYSHISYRPTYIDELTHRCGSSTARITSLLLQLELKRLVKQLPGKNFVRAASVASLPSSVTS